MSGVERALEVTGKFEVNAHSIAAAGVTLYRQEVEAEKKQLEADQEELRKELKATREALEKSIKGRAKAVLGDPLEKIMAALTVISKLGIFSNPRYDLHYYINDDVEATECRVQVTLYSASGKTDDNYPLKYERGELDLIKRINGIEEDLRELDHDITQCELRLSPNNIEAMKDRIEGGITMENLKHFHGGEAMQRMIDTLVHTQRKSEEKKCLPAAKKRK